MKKQKNLKIQRNTVDIDLRVYLILILILSALVLGEVSYARQSSYSHNEKSLRCEVLINSTSIPYVYCANMSDFEYFEWIIKERRKNDSQQTNECRAEQ
jgi:hypothetical protein